MQDLLRQRGNTAELCSLRCQHSSKGEEGGVYWRRRRRRGRKRRESANNVILFRRQCCSQLCLATRTQHRRPPGSKFLLPSTPTESPRRTSRYTSPLLFVSFSMCVSHLSATLPKCASRGVDVCVSVCMPPAWKLLLPPLHQSEPGSQSAVGIVCPLIHV